MRVDDSSRSYFVGVALLALIALLSVFDFVFQAAIRTGPGTFAAKLLFFMPLVFIALAGGAFYFFRRKVSSLTESLERVQSILSISDSAIAILDRDGVILSSSGGFDEIFQYGPGELESKNVTSLLREKERGKFRSLLNSLGDGPPLKAEGIQKSWSRIMIEAKIRLLVNGVDKRLVVTVRDISNEQKLEDDLLRLEDALDHADEAFILADSDGVIEYTNTVEGDGAQTLSKGEILRVDQGLSADSGENKKMWDILHTGRSYKTELARLNGGGAPKHEEVFVYPVKDGDGEVKSYFQIRREITARKNYEKKISTLLRAIEHSADLIIVTDTQGNIEYANPAVSEKTGYLRPEIIGKRPSLFNSGVHDESFFKDLWSSILQGRIWTGRITNLKKTGGFLEEELRISPVFDDEGAIVNFVAVGRDVSEKVEREAQLIKAKDAAENSGKEKDRLISIVSHDLKNPLTASIGLLSYALEESRDELGRKSVQAMKKALSSNERMLDIIDNLLTTNPNNFDGLSISRRFFSVRALSDLVVDDLMERISQKKITVHNEIPREMRWNADYHLIYQVVLNIISNAAKFTSRGGAITLRASRIKDSIDVIDNGAGISADMLPDIFRKDVTTTTRGTDGERGYGMGLPFCHEVIRLHGGDIKISSTPGEGSVFTLGVPSVRPLVMLVDDDDDFRIIIKELLTGMGVDLLEAHDGEQALKIMHDKPPSMIITDLYMEPVNGFELLKSVRNSKSPIARIAVTSDTNASTRQRAFDSGAQDVLTKPVIAYDFFPRVKRFLEIEYTS